MSAPVLAFVNPQKRASSPSPFKDHPLFLVHLCWLQMFHPDIFDRSARSTADITKRLYDIEDDEEAADLLREMEADAQRRTRRGAR